jgi:ABC-type multidrug transport system ATPase subunit
VVAPLQAASVDTPTVTGPGATTPSSVRASAPVAANAMVSGRGLTKRFAPRARIRELVRFARRAPPVTVVDGVSLDVYPGEVFGLLGPNGAGKTTIFKMLATMIAPDAGKATVSGFDVARDAASVRGVLASVPADERSLNWRISADENLRLFAALQHIHPREVSARIAWALDTVALADTGDKRVAEFSSGMRQRLLIARALLTRPRILLLDEPTRTLDPLSARELRRFLREELVAVHGCTILLATHNPDEAFGFCDRVAVLHRGRVLATGAASELAARFGEDRYRIVVTGADEHVFAALESRGMLHRRAPAERTLDGWDSVECTIGGGPARSVDLIRALIGNGVALARLERIEPSLADLISRIIKADGGRAADA